ncbi:MAG: ribosome small subunit-dependent GTPase A [Proteobacteria bacterium]|nr:ribosome small subunit-dependent GTPase A [Pseudomonadota bacterium]MDA0869236.1 ribosome small subunit-dependent GTPase A [Pseudomonadota bacterium]MDA1328310.1 ribosome small subunit-dependent GTPase A [Pseudomonadota bacterium]
MSLSRPPTPAAARVVADFGQQWTLQCADGSCIEATARGKRRVAVTGDWVQWTPAGDRAQITSVHPRHNVLWRQDDTRSKTFAANVSRVVVVVAAQPTLNNDWLDRALVAAAAAGIEAELVVNKSDLAAAHTQTMQQLEPYAAMGYALWPMSVAQGHGVTEWAAHAQGHVSLLLGASGVGKSSLLNQVVPQARALTQSLSAGTGTGRHTTTHTAWHWLDHTEQGALIDSPGFQNFGLHHLSAEQLAGLMPDVATLTGGCRFYNCGHTHEPGCSVRSALDHAPGTLTPARYAFYCSLYNTLLEAQQAARRGG